MATNKPCRFKTAEINKLIKHLPATEKRLLVKLKHYAKTTVEQLCKEDKLQREAATARRVAKIGTDLNTI